MPVSISAMRSIFFVMLKIVMMKYKILPINTDGAAEK